MEELIRAEGLYAQELAEMPMPDAVELLRKAITVKQHLETGVAPELRVSFAAADREQARRVVRRVLEGVGQVREDGCTREGWFPREFRCTASVRWNEPVPAEFGSPMRERLKSMVLHREVIQMQSFEMPEFERFRHVGREDVAQRRLLRRVRFSDGECPHALRVEYRDSSAVAAQTVLLSILTKSLYRYQRESTTEERAELPEILEPASLPESPEGLTQAGIAGTGGGIGLVAGALWMLARRRGQV